MVPVAPKWTGGAATDVLMELFKRRHDGFVIRPQGYLAMVSLLAMVSSHEES